MILGADFLERYGVSLDYANGEATISMTGCKYPLRLRQEPLELSEEKTPENSQPEKLGQLLEVSYHEWKSLARRRGAEASIAWVRETQAGADNFAADVDDEKREVLAECNYLKPTSGRDDVARFGAVALEAAKNFLEDHKVTD